MIISAIALVFVLFDPNSWTITIGHSSFAHAEGSDNEDDLKEVATQVLREVGETVKVFRKEGVKLDVSPQFEQVVNQVTSTIVTATGAFVGSKIAASISSPADKAAVIAGSVVILGITKAVMDNLQHKPLFVQHHKESDNDEINTQPPTDNDFNINSIYEPEFFDGTTFLPGVESTDALNSVLESLLVMSGVNNCFLIIMAINLIIIFIKFENFKWVTDRPKLFNMLNKSKTARKALLVYLLCVLLFSNIFSFYVLNFIIEQLSEFKSF